MMVRNTIYLITLFSFTFLNAYSQSVLMSEDFNNCALPNDWEVELIGNQEASWFVGQSQNPEYPDVSIDGSCMLIIDDDQAGENAAPAVTRIKTSSFDGSSFSTINFNVDIHFRHYEETAFRVLCFDGENYRPVSTYQYSERETGESLETHVNFYADLSYYANDNMHLVFEYDDAGLWGWHAGFDNIIVTGEGDFVNLRMSNFNDCEMPEFFWGYTWLGEQDWSIGYATNTNISSSSMNGSCFAFFDDDIIGEEAPFSGSNLGMGAFDGREYAEIYLEFDLIFRKAVEYESIRVNIWDGERVHNVQSWTDDVGGPEWNNFERVRVDLSSFRMDNMSVYFDYYDGNGWGWYVGVDNVKLQVKGSLNDDCVRAKDITVGEDCVLANNINALNEGVEPACNNGEMKNALWYKFSVPNNGLYKISSDSDFNDVLTVLEGTCGSMNATSCKNRDEHGFIGEDLYFSAEAGKEYYLQVAGIDSRFGKANGELCLSINPVSSIPVEPSNTSCASAVMINLDGDCISGTNLNAELDSPIESSIWARHDIWYSFMATTEHIEILSNADFSDVMTLYNGTCGNLSVVNSSLEGKSLKAYDLNVDELYFIQVAGSFATIEGNVCMQIIKINNEEPDNDECIDAIALNIDGQCQSISFDNASFDGISSSCIISADGDTWYSFIAPPSEVVYLNSNGSIEHAISVYKGVDCSNLEQLYCAKKVKSCDAYHKIENLIEGRQYFIQLALTSQADGSISGDFCVELLDEDPGYIPLQLNVSVACDGEGIGHLMVQTIGGSGELTYEGNTADDVLYTGDEFIIIVRDENGCEVSDFGVFDCGEIACDLSGDYVFDDVSCAGNTDGSFTINLQNFEEPVSYNWSNGNFGAVGNGLAAGTYEVMVNDANNCTLNFEIVIEEPDAIQATITTTNESSYEAVDGIASITSIGGTGDLQYNWSNGATGSTVSGLAPGNYTVEVVDENDCQEVFEFTIVAFECNITVEVESIDVLCFGEASGSAGLIVDNASGDLSFVWSNGATSQGADNLSAGFYEVNVMDENNCSASISFEIAQAEPLSSQVLNNSMVSCFGETNGTAAVQVSGGTPPYTYEWSNGFTAQEQSGLAAGTYIVTAFDANQCETSVEINVSEPSVLEVQNTESIAVTCSGVLDGQASVEVSGGTAPYEYFWSNGSVGQFVSGLEVGTYEVEIEDAQGCMVNTEVEITGPTVLELEESSQIEVLCFGESSGSITLSAMGGTPPYDYNWSNGNIGTTTDNLMAGNYNVIVSDDNGCELNLDFVIAQPAQLVLSLNTSNESGNQANDGAASVSIEGGLEPYSIIWSNGLEGTNINDLPPGDYQVTVTDANGCESVSSFVISNFNCGSLLASNIVADVSCNGGEDGSIEININGGTAPYTYLWSNGATSDNLTALEAGSYELTVSDADNCTSIQTILISEPEALSYIIEDLNDVSCFGEANGNIEIVPFGGTGNYVYNWSNGFSSAASNELSQGVYTIILSDQNSCSIEIEFEINEPNQLSANIESNNESAFEANDGFANVIVDEGTAPYTYLWSTGAMTQSISNLGSGEYTVTVNDANNCEIISTVIISSFDCSFEISISSTDVTCFGESNGSAELSVSDGEGPFQFEWSDGSISSNVSNLSAGTYSVTVIDANDCPAINSFTIAEPAALNVLTEANLDLVCENETSGSITLNVSGGTAPYIYNWSNGADQSSISALAIGVYTVLITDANDCIYEETFEVESLDESAPQILTNDLTVRLNADGMAMISIEEIDAGTNDNCGIDELSLSQNTFTCDDLGENTISFTAVDVNRNVNTSDVIITVIDDSAPSLFCPENIIATDCEGRVTYNLPFAQDNCGNDELTITLIAGKESGAQFDVGTTTVTHEVSDASGNKTTCSFDVTVVEPVSLAVTTNPTLCFGEANGSAYLNTSGGTPGFTFEWSNGEELGSEAENLAAGEYVVTVTDANDCISEITFTIEESSAIELDLSQTNVDCFDEATGSASVNAQGGNPGYTYEWSNGETSSEISDLSAGTYSVIVTDVNGCSNEQTFEVLENEALVFALDSTVPATTGNADGALNVTISGGAPPYVYNWYLDGEIISNEEDLSGFPEGIYQLEVFDDLGCSIIALSLEISAVTSSLSLEAGEKILLSPNPSNGIAFLDYSFNEKKEVRLLVYDINGKLIFESVKHTQDVGQFAIDGKKWPAANYQVKLLVDDKIVVKQLIIIK